MKKTVLKMRLHISLEENQKPRLTGRKRKALSFKDKSGKPNKIRSYASSAKNLDMSGKNVQG